MASREEEIKHRMLIAAKKVKRDVESGAYNPGAGICSGIANHPALSSYAWKEVRAYLAVIFERWPEFSGSSDYPICSRFSFYDANETYMRTKNKWHKWSAYNRARHRLLDFIIDTLVKEQGDA